MVESSEIQGKSVYIFEYSVQPGAARLGIMLASNSIDSIKCIIEDGFFLSDEQCCRGVCASLAALSHPTHYLWIVQRGRVSKAIDLAPHITLSIAGSTSIAISETGKLAEVVKVLSKGYPFENDLFEIVDCTFAINWPAILANVPPLTEPLLQPGEILKLEDPRNLGATPSKGSYLPLAVDDVLHYGGWDYESGEEFEVPEGAQ